MDLNFVRELVGLVSRSAIAELQIERDGLRVRIARQRSTVPSVANPPELPQDAPGLGVTVPASPRQTAPASVLHSIRAPLTGVFYRSAAEGEPPLVAVGDVVEEGRKVGVLEAMKTFNVVESDRAGRIVEIAFDDHAAVQAGDVLFVLEEAA